MYLVQCNINRFKIEEMCLGCCLDYKCFKSNLLHTVLVFTFFLDKKGNQKIKHGMIPPGIRACQRLPIA
jgi:hypothetical protein